MPLGSEIPVSIRDLSERYERVAQVDRGGPQLVGKLGSDARQLGLSAALED